MAEPMSDTRKLQKPRQKQKHKENKMAEPMSDTRILQKTSKNQK